MTGDVPMTLANCPVRATLDVLRGKWKPLILYLLKPAIRRYGDLRANLPEASEKVLIQQLRELERDGIVGREVYREIPPRVEYHVTPYGETLMDLLQLMANWGDLHRTRPNVSLRKLGQPAAHFYQPWFDTVKLATAPETADGFCGNVSVFKFIADAIPTSYSTEGPPIRLRI